MKTREGFVSNSSSASFVLKKNMVSEEQLEKVRNHSKEGKKLGLQYAEDEWNIREGKRLMKGDTYMANFNMREFFQRIGISSEAYTYDEDG